MSTSISASRGKKQPGGRKKTHPGARTPRTSGPRWGRIAGVIAGLAVLLAIVAAVVYFTPLMALKNVEVEGNAHVSEDDVVSASGVEMGVPLAQVKPRDAASGVVSLPWVRTATASRQWPSTLKLEIVENRAVAYFNGSDGSHLIDPEGREFAVDTPPEEAVELTGEAATDEAVRKGAVGIAAELSEPGLKAVESIEARGRYNYVLNLREEKTVVWGASEDNRNKSLALDTVLQREGGEFNVVNPQQITVR